MLVETFYEHHGSFVIYWPLGFQHRTSTSCQEGTCNTDHTLTLEDSASSTVTATQDHKTSSKIGRLYVEPFQNEISFRRNLEVHPGFGDRTISPVYLSARAATWITPTDDIHLITSAFVACLTIRGIVLRIIAIDSTSFWAPGRSPRYPANSSKHGFPTKGALVFLWWLFCSLKINW